MPILRVNANGCTPELGRTDRASMCLSDALKANLGGGPVLIMLHGYRYSPSQPSLDPHNFILQNSHKNGWPQQMGYSPDSPHQGLCIAFGWEAGGTIWRAYREASRAGLALASLIKQIATLGAGPVNIMAHSLGVRVALASLPHLAPGMIGRMILLTGAELRTTAEAALITPAGQSAQVLNIISRENDIFDFLYEWLLAPHHFGARTMGAGISLPNCVTAQIDDADHLTALRCLGFPVPVASKRVCHWSSYTRPGLFPLYRGFLSASNPLDLADLRARLPITLTPRWSRLRSRPLRPAPFAVQ